MRVLPVYKPALYPLRPLVSEEANLIQPAPGKGFMKPREKRIFKSMSAITF